MSKIGHTINQFIFSLGFLLQIAKMRRCPIHVRFNHGPITLRTMWVVHLVENMNLIYIGNSPFKIYRGNMNE